MKKFLVLFCLVVSGCGGGSTTTPPQIQDISGQWSLIATDTANNTTAVFANFTSQGGGNFFATGVNTAVCDLATSQCQAVQNTPNINATVSSSSQVGITFSNVITTAGAVVTANASGTLMASPGASSPPQMSGNWTASDGTSGTWIGYKSSSFTGNYTGSVNSTATPSPVPISVNLTLTQDGSYNLTASATVTNSTCYTTLSFTGQTVGGMFHLTNSAASGLAANSVVIFGIQSNPSTPNVFLAGYQLLAGCDSGDQGTGTLTKQS